MTTTVTPPLAEQRPHTIEIHGHAIPDEYAWLQRRDDPAVVPYLEAEDVYKRQGQRLSSLSAGQRLQVVQLLAAIRATARGTDGLDPLAGGHVLRCV